MKAIADVKALIPRYKSDSEQQFALLGAIILRDALGIEVAEMRYEPCRWAIPGGHYTPDWLAILDDGRVVFIEVKGSKKQRNYRDARSKLRAAAAMYPFFSWCETVEEDGWRVEMVKEALADD